MTPKQIASTTELNCETEERYRQLVELSPDCILVHSKGKILYANPSAAKIVKAKSTDQLIGKNLLDFVHPDNLEVTEKRLNALESRNVQSPFREIKLQCLDGSISYLEMAGAPILLNGEVAYQSIGRDISNRKMMECESQHIREKLQALSDASFEAIFLSAQGICLNQNSTAEKLFGYTLGEAIGRKSTDWIAPQDRKKVQEKTLLGFESPYTIFALKKNGETFPAEIQSRLIEYNGKLVHVTALRDITERKKAEDTLALANSMLEQERNIFVAGPVVVFKWKNAEGWPVEYVSSNVQEFLGYSPEEFYSGRVHFTSLIQPEDCDRIAQKIQSISDGGVSIFSHEPYRLIRADGRVIWVDDYTSVIRDTNGNITHYLGYLLDITKSKKADDSLRLVIDGTAASAGKEFFKSLVNHLAIALDFKYVMVGILSGENRDEVESIAFHANGKIVDNFTYSLNGTPCEKVVFGKYCCFPKDVQELFPEDLYLQEINVQSYVGKPLIDTNGKVLGLIALLDDKPMPDDLLLLAESLVVIFAERATTELQRIAMLKVLQESNSRTELALEGAQLGMWECDARTGEYSWDQRMHLMMGYKEDEIAPKFNFVEEFVHPNDRETVKRAFIAHLNKHTEAFECEFRIILHTGEMRWSLDRGKVIERDENGIAIRITGTHLDITETKRLRELSERASRLESAGKIAGQVAHDFNNLLGPLMAYPELLLDELPENSDGRQLVKDMESAARQMSEINQQLLTLGRRGHYNQQPMNLNNLITQLLGQVTKDNVSLNLKTDLAPDLLNFKGGNAQILRVLSNLVANALDAIEPDGILAIKTENYYLYTDNGRIRDFPRGEYIKLTISDNGCGISNEDFPFIFEPFFTTKKTDKKQGSGLGLSVVHGVLEDHNAYIDCESSPGQGTIFFLYFPVTREEIVINNTNLELHKGTGDILVVDDDQQQRTVSRVILEKLGYNVRLAESGERAIEMIKDKSPDMLVLDMIMLPGIDGTETYRRALEINPKQKAIIVSGYAEGDRVREALALGATTFVKKPITIRSISEAISLNDTNKPIDSSSPTILHVLKA